MITTRQALRFMTKAQREILKNIWYSTFLQNVETMGEIAAFNAANTAYQQAILELIQ